MILGMEMLATLNLTTKRNTVSFANHYNFKWAHTRWS